MEYFAIKDKLTGKYLPLGPARFGHIHATGAALAYLDEAPPRLFLSGGAAACALRWWLKGEMHRNANGQLAILKEREHYVSIAIVSMTLQER